MSRIFVLIGSYLLSTIITASAADPRKFSCNGSLIEPSSLAPSPKSVALMLSSANSVSMDVGKGATPVSVTSNNKIQLKFVTKDFVGEYFYYSGDLFLIYKSGHLARLTCTPN